MNEQIKNQREQPRLEGQKIQWVVRCAKCDKRYPVTCTYEELQELLEEGGESACHQAPYKRVYTFAKGIFKGTGFTKRTT